MVKDASAANWLPMPLPGYKPGGRKADMADAAWAFLGEISDASAAHPLKTAYRRTADAATGEDWTWQSYDTVRRRFAALPEGERALLRSGRMVHVRTLQVQKGIKGKRSGTGSHQ
ncbi:DNA-binding domain-containing protein [Segnochrobactraceae bacterium EtOH-i3]